MALFPIPTTRSSEMLAQTRLMGQLQRDSLDILRLQTQLSTGYRIQSPGEDPAAALRAQGIQRLLELKSQVKTNLSTSQSYLDATDTAISSAATMLSNARGIAVASAGSTISQTERKAAAVEIDRILQQLVDSGNQQFRGRYLFAGSRTNTQPFEVIDGKVAYRGNNGEIRSYADTDLLFDANVSGDAMFGAISAQQQGSVDLNPVLSANTRLADLNNGRGITTGSLVISDGNVSTTVDISRAETIGDVARLIEANPPAGRAITARVGAQGLVIGLNASGGGSLSVREVGGGTTAAELGVATIGAGLTLTGSDLNPILRGTTRLADILGVRGSAIAASTGTNNDIAIEAKNRGIVGNGVTLQYVDDSLLHAAPGLTTGNETVSYSATAVASRAAVSFSGFGNNLLLTGGVAGTSLNNVQIVVDGAGAVGDSANVTYDATNKVLHLAVDSTGATQVQTLVNAINAQGTFAATSDLSDASDGPYSAAATISAADIGVVSGSTGNSGAAANTFLVSIDPGATTANHVLAALQADVTFTANFTAALDAKDTTSSGFAGKGFVQLTATATTSGGAGEDLDLTSGLRITNGGDTFNVDVFAATNVEELLNILNGSGANILAEINESSTGINIRSRLSGADLSIGENGGTTASQLGLRSFTSSTALSELNYGAGVTPSGGTDFIIHRNDGVNLAVNLTGAQTIGDVINLINNHANNLNPPTRVVARLAQFGNGIELIDDNPQGGGRLSVEQAIGSNAAQQLGLVPRGSMTSAASTPATRATAAINFPTPNDTNTGLSLTAATAGTGLNGVNIVFQNTLVGDVASAAFNSGTNTLTISLDTSATTANSVLNAINADGTFTAALNLASDPTNDGSGIVGTTGTLATTAGGTAETFISADSNPREVSGAFSSLIRLREALLSNDAYGLERAVASLDVAFENVNFARAEVGARSQSLDTLSSRLQDEEIELKKNLSDDIEVDWVAAAGEFQARQAAYQASLQLSGQIFKLSLLDYL